MGGVGGIGHPAAAELLVIVTGRSPISEIAVKYVRKIGRRLADDLSLHTAAKPIRLASTGANAAAAGTPWRRRWAKMKILVRECGDVVASIDFPDLRLL